MDVPAVTEDEKDSKSQQVDDTHTTAQASPPLQKSRRILSASSDFFNRPLYLKLSRENIWWICVWIMRKLCVCTYVCMCVTFSTPRILEFRINLYLDNGCLCICE